MSGAGRMSRLREQLAAHGATQIGEVSGRVGAVLALLGERGGDLEVVLTRRRDDLPTHPGQVSFAGGRRESGETTTEAAVREAHEEIGLRPDSVEVLGHLPPFFIPPSRFWLAPVVAWWARPHVLRPQESEVAAIVRAPVAHLLDTCRWRKVRLSNTGWSLAWQLDDEHVLWGATGAVTSVLLDMMEPDWRGGVEPADLPDDREIMPWRDPALERRARPPVLEGVATRDRAQVPLPASTPPGQGDIAAVGAGVAMVVDHLRRRPGHVVVLAGGGANGAAGMAAARALHSHARVTLVTTGRDRAPHGHIGQRFAGSLPAGDLYVDALVGGGLHGRLHGVPLDMLLALRTRDGPILALDLPSGLHPSAGLVGDTIAATLTLALGGVWPALRDDRLAPFVGDLYLWGRRHDEIVRLQAGPARAAVEGAR